MSKTAVAQSRKCETSIVWTRITRSSIREARERIASPVAKTGEGKTVAKVGEGIAGVPKELRISLCCCQSKEGGGLADKMLQQIGQFYP